MAHKSVRLKWTMTKNGRSKIDGAGDSDVDDIVMLVSKKNVGDIFLHEGDMPIRH